jgi:hypothetical protein
MQTSKNALICFFLLMLQLVALAKIEETPFTEYTYNAKTCQGIRHGSGSEIFIPENAFVLKKDGKVCDGKIIVKYREFHSQADMIAANIPMDFMQGKQKHQLESGGMFQVLAECNGQELELAKGKQIQVRFASRNDLEYLDAFYFDPKKGWQLLNTPITDFSVREGNNNSDLWGKAPQWTTEGGINISRQIIEVQANPDDPYSTYDSVIISVSGRMPGIFKGTNIDKMGLYNYDRILNEEGSVPFAADFKIKGTGEKITTTVFVTYTAINSVIYYPPGDWEEKFALLPGKDVKIFTMLKDGTVAVFPQNEIEKLNLQNLKDGQYTFELEIVKGVPQTKQQLAQKTGINY